VISMDPWTIVATLGGVIAALGGVIAKLYADLSAARAAVQSCLEARIAAAEESYRELSVLRDMIVNRMGKNDRGKSSHV